MENQETLLFILMLLVIILYIKWIFILLILPIQRMYSYYMHNRNVFTTIISIPYRIVNKIFNGGYELWSLYAIGLVPCHHFRDFCIKMAGVKMAKHSIVYIGFKIRSPWNLKIGKGSIIGDNAILDARSGIEIGKNVNISSNVSIWTLQHDHRDPNFGNCKNRRLDVKIEDRAWLGCNVIVLPGVTIGEGAVCCGGCVVTKDVPPYTIVAGIPATKVGERPRNIKYEFKGSRARLW